MPNSKKTKKILIAEDEKNLADILVLKLKKEGFSVKTVENGEEALQALSKSDFDLLLLDLIMPKKNGLEVLEALKNKNKKTKLKIMIITNLSQPEAEAKARKLGVKVFLVKSEVPLDEVVKKAVLILK